ncbi:hypothetical protein HK102_000758 [Quaeritorhiza haematococci]|nr:hypothetical protein HK102_000758 [Quaeritorhiza haematococci]
MLFSIAIHRGGLVAAIAAFIVWSLPGLIVMTALALGVSKLPTPLPPWLIQITNGVSAAAVGLVAQAGVSLARKIVKAHPQMIVCTLAACAAVLWRASWLEPVVIVGGGVVFGVVVWVTRAWNRWQTDRDLKNRKKKDEAVEADVEEGITDKDEEPDQGQQQKVDKQVQELEQGHVPMSWKMGIVVIAVIVILLVVCMVLKPQLMENRAWAVITQFYVAGCVIFGGGPVVIPLLYGYVVDPGFVSPRDFLLGVALIQAMPGPNFNFASYCGALVLAPYGPAASIGGALLGYTGIFFPGLALNAAVVPLWSYIRKSKRLLAVLPGINAAAVGLVFSAAFAVWEKGIVRGDVVRPLGDFPFYAVVAGVAFVLVDWGVRTPVAMLFGAVMGVIGWGVGV